MLWHDFKQMHLMFLLIYSEFISNVLYQKHIVTPQYIVNDPKLRVSYKVFWLPSVCRVTVFLPLGAGLCSLVWTGWTWIRLCGSVHTYYIWASEIQAKDTGAKGGSLIQVLKKKHDINTVKILMSHLEEIIGWSHLASEYQPYGSRSTLYRRVGLFTEW